MSKYGIYQTKLNQNHLNLFEKLNDDGALIDIYSDTNISEIYERTIHRSGEDLEDVIDKKLTIETENPNSKVMHHLLYVDLLKCQNLDAIINVYPIVSSYLVNKRLIYFGMFVNLLTDQILLLSFREDKLRFFAIDAEKDILVYSLSDSDADISYFEDFCRFDLLNSVLSSLGSIKSASLFTLAVDEMIEGDDEIDREDEVFEFNVSEAYDEFTCVKIYLPTFNEHDERFENLFGNINCEISDFNDRNGY